MNDNIKIGIIGAGNMGGAIARGLSKSLKSENIIICEKNNETALMLSSELKIRQKADIKGLSEESDVVIIAVKPAIVEEVLQSLKDYSKIIISVAAGVTIHKIEEIVGNKKIIRAMPNTPAISGCAMTVLSLSNSITDEESQIALSLFESLGRVIILDEKYMNAVTAISGSGPAYVFTFIQAIADAGVKLGLTRNDSLLLAGQTIFGSAKMFLDKMENPIKLRDNVTSPGGTTIAAVHTLERSGFSGVVMDAIEEAFKRAKELEKLT
ncbi:MAG TPA: pyrroline-5-carboxylate reductase [Spirochaetota bacterium]|nr:pyrroline-5-carboxylate reductase [Spirochaetota bacterium]HOK92915.1 pyrroline-5-carboxylate reductase [Spirochaetota bacterium]